MIRSKESIEELYIEKIEIENTDLVNTLTREQLKNITINACDKFYRYEIKLNNNYMLMEVPTMLYEKYDLAEVQKKIDEMLGK